MPLESTNPATNKTLATFDYWDNSAVERALKNVAAASTQWQNTDFPERAALMKNAAKELRKRQDHYAGLIVLEVGKIIKEARGEIEKCAAVCDYYADHAESFLADEIIESDAGRSLVAYLPLGTVLAVMPWNFPFWQVLRFAAPSLMAGNTGVLKHASNVPQCAAAIEEVFSNAGFPDYVFCNLPIAAKQTAAVIEDPRIHAITLTGSEPAGRQVASTAGHSLKKSVLELGGSDAFMVLADADLDEAATIGVASRYLNCGQSCIASKRFIVVEDIADDFLKRFKEKAGILSMGNPADENTTLGPMARQDLRDELHQQVTDSIAQGAKAILGCTLPDTSGSYYPASILDRVQPGIRAYEEELFGPVAIFIRAKDEADALRIANDSRFGLGGSIWTSDLRKGETLARQMQSGATFINGIVKSDPRLPFGGIKASGYGRELSQHGIREFVNTKTIWIK